MALVDWRELYAANRAEIERHLGTRGLKAGLRSATPSADVQPRRPVTHSARRTGRPAHPQGGLSYVVHKPATVTPETPVALVMMLHGCTQDAASIAAGTRMNEVADRRGFVVVYPEQSRRANPQGCWNWFLAAHQSRGGGEPAALAGVLRSVMAENDQWSVDPARVFVAGMSAGGAMASVMAATHPDLFAAVAVHSGLAYGAARSQAAALAAMSGAGPAPERLGELALEAMATRARPVPAIVLHGSKDRVVKPINAERTVAQWMAANRLLAPDEYAPELEHPSSVVRGHTPGGHKHTCSRWVDRRGRLMGEYVRIEGLGHAWSGGARGGSYTDPRGPSASEMIWRFFEAVATDN